MKKFNHRPNYGVDAPSVVYTFFIVTLALCLLALLAYKLPRATLMRISMFFVAGSLLVAILFCFITAILMLWSSKIGKLKARNKIIEILNLKGDEIVLDAGCGRGLLLLGIAKRLISGKAYGVDIWQKCDLSSNSLLAVEENALIEDVAHRIHVETTDIRSLPFENETFDVIVSSLVLHNIYDPFERLKALQELVRVLKANGTIVLQDIQHAKEYEHFLKEHNFTITLSTPTYLIFPPAYIVRAIKH